MIPIDEQVKEVLSWFEKADEHDQDEFRNTPADGLVIYHNSLGKDIRNHFGLWDTKWEPEIINGVDMSQDHPDEISMKVIKAVWEKVNE